MFQTTKQKKYIAGVVQPDEEKKRLLPNAVFAIIQVLVSSVILFLLYRFLLKQLGTEALGVWTLVMAATSLANISNLGIAGGIVRFVSNYLAKGDFMGAAIAVETGIISLTIVIGLVGLSLWLPIEWGLEWIIPLARLPEAKALLPYALLALWLSAIGGVVHSALEGCHRSDLRSISTLVCLPLMLIGALVLTPSLGLQGMALAQIGQYIAWIILGWSLLKRQIAPLPHVPLRWSKKFFAEMWRYGVNFQMITILQILSEPLAKGLLSHYSSLSSVAYFEMANRLVLQARATLTSANQVITPYYAKLQSTDVEKIAHIYLRNLQLISLLSSMLFATIIAASPLISVLWIGYIETEFLIFLGILSLGWFANTLSVPAYYANLGIAHLSPNVHGSLAIMLSMLIVGTCLGPLLKPYGSAFAWPAGLLIGSIFIDEGFRKCIRISRTQWVSSLLGHRVLINFMAGLIAALASLHYLASGEQRATLIVFVCMSAGLTLMALLNLRKVQALVRLNIRPPDQAIGT